MTSRKKQDTINVFIASRYSQWVKLVWARYLFFSILILILVSLFFGRFLLCQINYNESKGSLFFDLLKMIPGAAAGIIMVLLGIKGDAIVTAKSREILKAMLACSTTALLWAVFLGFCPAPLESECSRTTATPGPKASPVSASTPSPSWPPPELIAATIEALGQFDEFSDPDKIQNIIALEPGLDACEKHIRYNIGSQADLCEEVVQQLQRCPDDKGAGVVTLLRTLARRHQGDSRASALENLAQEWERTP